jgi:hypothetical protein
MSRKHNILVRSHRKVEDTTLDIKFNKPAHKHQA